MRKLTPKQQKFADEYIISGNASEAARKAGYSEKTARFIGAENLTKPNIRTYVNKKLEKLEASKYLSMDEALRLTAAIARGEPKAVQAGVNEETGEPISRLVYPSFNDQKGALEQFYRINGAFIDNKKVEVSGELNANPYDELTIEELKLLAKECEANENT